MEERSGNRCADGNALHRVILVRIDWRVDRFETDSGSRNGAQTRALLPRRSRVWNARSLW